MKPKRRRALEAMSEHDALHEAERQLCKIADACIVMINLHRALPSLNDGKPIDQIMDIGKSINEKLKAAHAKYETSGGLH